MGAGGRLDALIGPTSLCSGPVFRYGWNPSIGVGPLEQPTAKRKDRNEGDACWQLACVLHG